ncbi:hypothetical protein LCGC14_1949840 [marine sediment metagenome]|uniref:Uncharacterized protein n=1 Tax=marine sediment metagenome TaxID=412755 RepID=A0A0F9FHQ5_9ZZZZ
MTRNVKNLTQTIEMTQNAAGKIKFAPKGLLGKAAYWKQAEGDEVVGDAAANGTTVVSLSIPAVSRFLCTSLMASTNIAAVINIASGVLGTLTEIYHIDLQNAGSLVMATEETPIFIYNNTTDAAVTLLMVVPLTAKGVATNNAANKYFHGFMGGIVIKN